MLYREAKKSGDHLSILGFGCMRLPQNNQGIDAPRATRQLHDAIDHGVNYIDTALPYHSGASEPFLGQVLQHGYRDKVFLATKLPHWLVRSREDMDRILRAQLKRLRTDHIDYYLLHSLEKGSWNKMVQMGALSFLDNARTQGLIRHAGFSFHGDYDTFTTIVDSYDWAMCMIQYSLLDEAIQAGRRGLLYAAERDLAVMVMEPLRGGLLAGRMPREITDIYAASATTMTPAAWALRWLWNQPEVSVVVSGMNEEAHIKENIALADLGEPNTLSNDELDVLHRVKHTFAELLAIPCTGCGYCMPCPAGVNIPACFEIFNTRHTYKDNDRARIFYITRLTGVTGTDKAYPSLCRDCGQCLEHCPQHLDIPALLQQVAKDFETPPMKLIAWLGRPLVRLYRWWSLRRLR